MTITTLPAGALPVAEHAHAGGSAGGPGENSAECACGTEYAGFDTHAEATAALDRHIETENAREKKRADKLAPGDLAVDILDGFDPWVSHRDGKVLASYPYADEVDNARVLLVVEGGGPKPKPETVRLDADTLVGLRSEAELEALRKVAERAARIADIRAFADWLEANPWVPAPHHLRASEQINSYDDDGVTALAQVREVAARLGVETDQHLDDRTRLEYKVGRVEYDLLAWHRDGRPDEPVPPVDEARTLTAAIYFSETRREALRALRKAGRPLGELSATTLELLHGQALAEDGERAQRADVREGEAGRVTNLELARFLAVKEDARREPSAAPVTVYFSFGYGQSDPDTGKNLLGRYVTIVGPSYEACRAAMFASKYGQEWSFDYLDGAPRTAKAIAEWTEHERIVLPADYPLPVDHSKACDDQDSDRPCLLDCPARTAAEAS
jgi:hypothetical protein